MKAGDTVQIHVHGKPAAVATATIMLASKNQRSLAVEFPEPPIFCKRILDSGGQIGINRETCRVTMLLMREELDGKPWGPWVVGQFELFWPKSATISATSHNLLVTPAAIAGVTRSVW